MKYILLFSAAIFLASCSRNYSIGRDESLVFGTQYGFCAGKCETLYKLTANQLYFDASKKRGERDFQLLPNEKYQTAQTLLNIPKAITGSKEKSFGCPDCADQGTILVQKISAGDTITRRLDNNTSALEGDVKVYAEKIRSVMAKLQ